MRNKRDLNILKQSAINSKRVPVSITLNSKTDRERFLFENGEMISYEHSKANGRYINLTPEELQEANNFSNDVE